MHYSNLVIIEKPEAGVATLEKAVEKTMGPSEEGGGFWDWYQIGGRWTGLLSGYDPTTDPANIEVCDLCRGTGDRKNLTPKDWKKKCNDCNGCHGTGKRTTWPTQWKQHDGDVIPIEQLTEEQVKKFYRIVTPYKYYEKERYTPWKEDKFEEMSMPTLEWLKKEWEGHLCVVVDNHS